MRHVPAVLIYHHNRIVAACCGRVSDDLPSRDAADAWHVEHQQPAARALLGVRQLRAELDRACLAAAEADQDDNEIEHLNHGVLEAAHALGSALRQRAIRTGGPPNTGTENHRREKSARRPR